MAGQDGGKTRSKVISHARQERGKWRSGLAGCPAAGKKARATGRPKADNAEQHEDRSGSERHWLQEAEKELTEGHGRIVTQGCTRGDVTSWVDLKCGDGREDSRQRCGARFQFGNISKLSGLKELRLPVNRV